jgi:mono/diheme cytochrome c family protein
MTRSLARTLLAATLGLAPLALLACGGGEEPKPAAAPAPAPEPVPAPAPAPVEPTPAAPAEGAAVGAGSPFACIAGNAEAGKAKYATLCASCHGATGAGDGVASAGLNPKPAHHNDGNYMNPLSNEHLVKVISEGGPAVGKSAGMAPWGAALGTQGVLDVVAFVRTLANPPYACP